MTDSYSLVIKRSAEKELKKLPVGDLRRVVDRIRGLTQQPCPPGCEKLSGEEERYRVRQGDYRIVYRIDEPSRTVDVVKIGHRREVYRQLDRRPDDYARLSGFPPGLYGAMTCPTQ